MASKHAASKHWYGKSSVIECHTFEPGSGSDEPGQKHSGWYGKSSVIECHTFDTIHLKLSAHAYFKVLFHSHVLKMQKL